MAFDIISSIYNLEKREKNFALSKEFAARVLYTIVDDKTNKVIFDKYGQWNSIGTIFFTKVNAPPLKNFDYTSATFAKPLFSFIKNYPLKNEIVYIISLPGPGINENVNDIEYYYFPAINLWNSNHHNGLPDPNLEGLTLPPSQQQDYIQTSLGAVRRITDSGSEIGFGTTFKERVNIKPTRPYEGDIIYEGRWGQSIRFGSTVQSGSDSLNNWSDLPSANGDPILIIKNGQYDDSQDPWIPQIENINLNTSSIYLTSTQTIPINVSSQNYGSYKSAPILPNKFNKDQIILNSGRLLFNTKTDSILLSSNKSINLNSVQSVNIDTKLFVLNTQFSSNSILLGSKSANQSIILGDKFLKDFKDLINVLISFSEVFYKNPVLTAPFTPLGSLPPSAIELERICKSIFNNIENYKSKISKTV